jgi:hypothetical protein
MDKKRKSQNQPIFDLFGFVECIEKRQTTSY